VPFPSATNPQTYGGISWLPGHACFQSLPIWMHDRSVPTFCQHISEGVQTRDRRRIRYGVSAFLRAHCKMGLSSSCHSYECMQISSDDSDVNVLGH